MCGPLPPWDGTILAVDFVVGEGLDSEQWWSLMMPCVYLGWFEWVAFTPTIGDMGSGSRTLITDCHAQNFGRKPLVSL